MKSKPLMLCLLAATILGSNLTIANGVLAQEPAGTASTTQATVKTITQQIAKLEVERAELEPRYSRSNPAIQAIYAKLHSLQQRLVQLLPNKR